MKTSKRRLLKPEILHSPSLGKTAMRQQLLQTVELSTNWSWTIQNNNQSELKTAVSLGDNFVLLSSYAALIFSYWSFGTPGRYHPEDGSNSLRRNVSKYHPTLRNIPEEQRYHLPSGWIIKSPNSLFCFFSALLTVQHLSIILAIDQLNAQIFVL